MQQPINVANNKALEELFLRLECLKFSMATIDYEPQKSVVELAQEYYDFLRAGSSNVLAADFKKKTNLTMVVSDSQQACESDTP